jgi:hypothetical protein
MNKLLYTLLLLIFIVLIFKYLINTEGMLENEKNEAIYKIDKLANSLKIDYKVFNTETTNMVIQQERMLIILGITSFFLVCITVIYVKNNTM